MCLETSRSRIRPFQVGDTVRRTGPDYESVTKGGIYTVSAVEDSGVFLKELGGVGHISYGSKHFELENKYPDTPAGRKQEQLDIIAEKEAILAETQKVIDEARARIAEIDNRPPGVGDVYAYGSANYTIVHIFEFKGTSYTNYQAPSGGVHCVKAATWTKETGGYTRVS